MTMIRATILLVLALTALPARAQPVLRGRVLLADTARADSLYAFARYQPAGEAAPRTDSARVSADGRFSISVPGAGGVEVVIDARGAARNYHPALARMTARDLASEQVFVLVPRRWTIPAGAFAGRTVEISPDLARRPVCQGCVAFWLRVEGFRAPAWFQSWDASSFPLRMALDRENAVPRGAVPDSAAFWRIARTVEDDYGADLFRPVRYAEAEPEEDDIDPSNVVLLLTDATLPISGLTTLLSRGGRVTYGTMRLRNRGIVFGSEGPRVVTHELMHTLGVGHTCAWRSVSADLVRCPEMGSTRLTPEDVAYTQVLYRVRNVQRAAGARWGLDAAIAGERVIILHRPAD
ncbi:hypothetical protein [Longimicrobium terrae]|uniref:Peptidase M10 metallopeptidase domain-containing protein n=1 Tax=Longimicrobium terrae TaxID=1639882 RepID=A0A841H1E1_9BACT|nr:hypothetical protein [Longimicrobium terrae]MBB4637404.1 hypothetical protein [Longimicrobium terrae]MBB6071802.1 hypothetical protein [Longimicrobium terrae]NNC28561.1 hypothetical protein [Longimicrobium terrae]